LFGILEPDSITHSVLQEWAESNLTSVSVDKFDFCVYHSDPELKKALPNLDILEAISRLTGKLVFEDCLRKTTDLPLPNAVVSLLGLGKCNKVAMQRALELEILPHNI